MLVRGVEIDLHATRHSVAQGRKGLSACSVLFRSLALVFCAFMLTIPPGTLTIHMGLPYGEVCPQPLLVCIFTPPLTPPSGLYGEARTARTCRSHRSPLHLSPPCPLSLPAAPELSREAAGPVPAPRCSVVPRAVSCVAATASAPNAIPAHACITACISDQSIK